MFFFPYLVWLMVRGIMTTQLEVCIHGTFFSVRLINAEHLFFISYCRSLTGVLIYMSQGDTKGSARGGDGSASAKKDPVGSQLSNHQVKFSENCFSDFQLLSYFY